MAKERVPIRRRPFGSGMGPFFDEFKRSGEEMDRLAEDFFRRRVLPLLAGPEEGILEEGQVRINAVDKGDKLIVKAFLPGLEKEDIDVSLSGNRLTISGERKEEAEEKEEDYYYREMLYGKFSRLIELPAEVEIDKAEASMKNGILEIVLPKSKPTEVKKLPIK